MAIAVTEDLLRAVVTKLVDNALNGALPALPIPSFTLPQSLAQYGLPAGKDLGLLNPSLALEPRHFVLRGTLGIK